jgi:hypothetical protein
MCRVGFLWVRFADTKSGARRRRRAVRSGEGRGKERVRSREREKEEEKKKKKSGSRSKGSARIPVQLLREKRSASECALPTLYSRRSTCIAFKIIFGVAFVKKFRDTVRFDGTETRNDCHEIAKQRKKTKDI